MEGPTATTADPYDDEGRRYRAVAIVAFAVYLVVLLALTFAPIGADNELGKRINLEPFATIQSALRHGPGSGVFRLMILNVVAFAPLGLLLPMVASWARGLVVVFVVALSLSAAIELGQLAVSQYVGYAYRSADVDDVILNVLGALVGYFLFAAGRFVTRWR